MKLDATRLRNGWAIRPVGCLGTHGSVDGQLWTVQYVDKLPENISIRRN